MHIFELDEIVRRETGHRFAVRNILEVETMREAVASSAGAIGRLNARLCRG